MLQVKNSKMGVSLHAVEQYGEDRKFNFELILLWQLEHDNQSENLQCDSGEHL